MWMWKSAVGLLLASKSHWFRIFGACGALSKGQCLEQGPGFVSLRIKVVALCKGVETMSKWKRKKYLENQVDTGEEEFSPLGLALLEQFAAGVSEPCF